MQCGVARMASPRKIREIMAAVSIPVMAKCRIRTFCRSSDSAGGIRQGSRVPDFPNPPTSKPVSDQADTEAHDGHLVKAQTFTRRAIDSARHNGDEETALSYAATGALRDTEFGRGGSASQQMAVALDQEQGR